MLWLYVSLIAYFLFAIAAIADRYLLAGPLPHPRLYGFYAGVAGIFAVVLMPLGFYMPPTPIIGLSLLAGVINIGALFLLYRAIFYGKISTVIPGVGAMVPLFALLFTFLLLGEDFIITPQGAIALLLLILGTIFLSLRLGEHRITLSYRNIANIAYAAGAFGLSFAMTKVVFSQLLTDGFTRAGFITGFVLMAFGGFMGSFLFLLLPGTRTRAFHRNFFKKPRVVLPYLIGKGAGSLGSLAQSYAISVAAVAQVVFISALIGVEYFFVLILVILFALKNPHLLKEELTRKSIPLRLVGIIFVAAGLFLLV